MKWLRTLAVVALLGLWLGATNHCKLEELPGLAFLVCGDHEGASPHQDNDCESDGCARVENGFYKTEDSQVTPLTPNAAQGHCLLADLNHPPLSPTPVHRDFLTVASPALPVSWQFFLRTARSPRAPSLDS